MPEAQMVTKVERSPRGLVDALFNSIDKLNNGLATSEEVRAVSHTLSRRRSGKGLRRQALQPALAADDSLNPNSRTHAL